MPSNHVLINNSKEYIVIDSRMDMLLRWLNENGREVDTGIRAESDEIICEVTSNIPIES
jgi:hypothetical protein